MMEDKPLKVTGSVLAHNAPPLLNFRRDPFATKHSIMGRGGASEAVCETNALPVFNVSYKTDT